MDHDEIVAVAKLGACGAVAIALLLIWCFGGDLWFRPIAAAAFIIVAAPVTLLVAIDTGKVFRRHRLEKAAATAAQLPTLLLGSIACIAGIGGIALSLFGTFTNPWFRIYGAVISIFVLIYGISLFRTRVAGP
jgi:hypothetical protein